MNFTRIFIILLVALLPIANARAAPSLVADEIAAGVFILKGRIETASPANLGDIANRGFIVGRDAVAVIDTGGSLMAGRALRETIRARTALPIRYVINTHMHPDHVLGNAAFLEDGAIFAGHAKLARALAARASLYLTANRALIGEAGFSGTQIVPPTLLVTHETRLDLGDRAITLEAHPTAHSDNDLTVLDEATGTLFLGDLVFSEHLPVIDGSLNGWLGVLEGLAARPAIRAVPGHGETSLPWPGGAAPQRAYLSALRSDLRAAVRGGWPLARALETVPAHDAEQWRLVEDYHRRNISAAFPELEWE